MRLDYIPVFVKMDLPGNTFVELDAVSLLEMSSQKAEFDAVPYGLCKPQTLKLKLAWSRLPAQLQDLLQTNVNIAANVWVLYTDRGTNGATWSVEFAGTPDNVETLELEPLGNGDYAYSIEVVDLAYMCMKTTNGKTHIACDWGEAIAEWGAVRVPNGLPWQVFLAAQRGRNQFGNGTFLLLASNTFQVMQRVATSLAGTLGGATNSFSDYTGKFPDLFDRTQSLRNIFTVALELYECTTDGISSGGKLRRRTGSALASNKLLLTTNVGIPDDESTTIGGLYSAFDDYGWGRADVSPYDIMRDLCEALGVKASYRYEIVPAGTYANQDANAIGIIWDIKRIGSSRDYANNVDTADVTLDMNRAITQPKITVRGENILKSEVRFETSNSEDKTEIVRISQGARASRSMNVEPIVHNIPIYLKEWDERRGRWEPFKQTNLLYFGGLGTNGTADGTIYKVHEDTLYWYGPGANQYVSVSSSASDNPVEQNDDNQQAYLIQLAALQVETSMASALTKLHLKAFSDITNALVEIEWPLTTSNYVLPGALAGRHNLTGPAATAFTSLAWSRALPVSIEVDWVEGTSKMTYFLLKPTTAN